MTFPEVESAVQKSEYSEWPKNDVPTRFFS